MKTETKTTAPKTETAPTPSRVTSSLKVQKFETVGQAQARLAKSRVQYEESETRPAVTAARAKFDAARTVHEAAQRAKDENTLVESQSLFDLRHLEAQLDFVVTEIALGKARGLEVTNLESRRMRVADELDDHKLFMLAEKERADTERERVERHAAFEKSEADAKTRRADEARAADLAASKARDARVKQADAYLKGLSP